VPVRFLILLLFSSSLFAQASYFGDRAPLTNTRYGALRGTPVLATNGAATFAFISTAHDVRMARGGDASARPVLNAIDGDAIWNGENFLVAGVSRGSIVARIVDGNGEPKGDAFTLVDRGAKPRLAIDGDRVVLLYENAGVRSLLLTRDGAINGSEQLIASNVRDFDLIASAVLLATEEGVKLVALTPNATIAAETHLSAAKAHAVSLASNGVNALALWARDGGIDAAVVANGVAREAFAIAEQAASPSVVWNGGAFVAAFVQNGAMRVASIDASARTATSSSLAFTAAADQSLADAASSANAALLVWNEHEDARIGLRARNGGWRERLLAANEEAVAAASDGQSFVVLTRNESGWSAAWLDDSGSLLRQSPRVNAFRARDVAMHANEAIVIGEANGNVVAARVSRDGSVSEPLVLRETAEDPVIATDGTHFFAAWQTAGFVIEGIRLDVALQKLDAEPVVVAWSDAEDPAVAFNGSHYVFVWREGANIRARRMTRDAMRVIEVVQISRPGGTPPHAMQFSPLGNGEVGLTWHDGRAQLALLSFAGEPWKMKTAMGFETAFITAPRTLALPGGSVAFVQSESGALAPHHGSARVAMAIAHPAPPVAPHAPRLSATANGGRAELAWNAQTAGGYRLEYRIDGGAWLEAEGWSDGDATSTTFTAPRNGVYAFRLRAWSDGGVSAYSDSVEVEIKGAGRRRAVR